jgi:AraC-like DNA-binding protein
MLTRFIADFDLLIEDVVLANAGNMHPGTSYRGYESGRKVTGLVAALSGCGTYLHMVDNQKRLIPLHAGEIALLPASLPYVVRNDHDDDFVHYTINFVLSQRTGTLADSPFLDEMQILKPHNLSACARQLKQLVETWNLKKPGFHMQCRAILYETLASLIWEKMQLDVDPHAYQKTLPACRAMDRRYREPLTLAELAQVCALSPTHFRRLFRSVYNMAPIDYLLTLRIQKAEDLLLSSHCTVQDVALLTGFQDASYFCRTFRQRVGVSPKQYRDGQG